MRENENLEYIVKLSDETVRLQKPEKSYITFGSENGWLMRITTDPDCLIEFNLEAYPNLLPSDFAKEVAKILSQSGYIRGLIS